MSTKKSKLQSFKRCISVEVETDASNDEYGEVQPDRQRSAGDVKNDDGESSFCFLLLIPHQIGWLLRWGWPRKHRR